MKKLEILRELPKCDSDTKAANAVRKMVLVDLLNGGLPKSPICKNHNI